jgi:hypothetical protein
MAVNRFDQASRYAAKLDPLGLLRWLLRGAAITFVRWLDTRSIPFPGEPDRTCDTVACLYEQAMPDVLWAVPIEFSLRPDGTLFGRLLEYLGRAWRELRPQGRSGRRRGRYQVGAAVVNLTGRRRTASLRMRLGQTRVLTRLGVEERNLAREDAAAMLAGIAAGSVPRCLLPLIPLMHGGCEAAIIALWVQLAQAEPDRQLRGDYGGLALVLAELAGCRPAWEQALGNWNMVESQVVLGWLTEGSLRARRDDLRMLLEERFGPLPLALSQRIDQIDDLNRLQAALRQVLHIQRLDDLQL